MSPAAVTAGGVSSAPVADALVYREVGAPRDLPPTGIVEGLTHGGRGGAAAGPLVAPGTYTVTITIPGVAKPLQGTVKVEADPLASVR